MESSVHFIAALRLLAKAAGLGEATQVSGATVKQLAAHNGVLCFSVCVHVSFRAGSVPRNHVSDHAARTSMESVLVIATMLHGADVTSKLRLITTQVL